MIRALGGKETSVVLKLEGDTKGVIERASPHMTQVMKKMQLFIDQHIIQMAYGMSRANHDAVANPAGRLMERSPEEQAAAAAAAAAYGSS